MKKITITDVTIRDGMHTIRHQFTPEVMMKVAAALDKAGVDIIEVGHGDGLAGSSIHVGRAAASDEEYLTAVGKVCQRSRISVLCVPGIATRDDLVMAAGLGVKVIRVGVHCTEADFTQQHICFAKELGLMTVGYLLSCSMAPPKVLAEQSKLMESYGADVIYLAESNGALLPNQVKEAVSAVRQAVQIPVGFHAHNNLGCAIGNTLAAVEAGAEYVDGSLKGFGGGAGNAQTEVLVAVLKVAGYQINTELFPIMDAVEKVFTPIVDYTPYISTEALQLGYSNVYGGYILPVKREAERFKVSPRDIIVELGRLGVPAGQEDIVISIAKKLSDR